MNMNMFFPDGLQAVAAEHEAHVPSAAHSN